MEQAVQLGLIDDGLHRQDNYLPVDWQQNELVRRVKDDWRDSRFRILVLCSNYRRDSYVVLLNLGQDGQDIRRRDDLATEELNLHMSVKGKDFLYLNGQ